MKAVNGIINNKKLFFVFFFSLFVLIFFSSNLFVYDSVWSYSFSYALANDQIPFLDFNMIIPGFYNFLMSIGLRLISDNVLVYFIEQSLLVTIGFYFLYKMYDRKAWLFLLAMCMPLFIAFSPTYNFGILFLAIIILYLEKNNKSDYLIGIFIGLSIMIKQSIGVCFLIPSIILYFKDKKKILRRFIAICIPWIIFFGYLIITSSLYQFLDLCLFGMFDFASNNVSLLPSYFILSMIFLVINILYVIKNKNDVVGYYVLCSFSVMIPIFCHYHFYFYLVFMSLLLMEKIKIDGKIIRNLSLILCLILLVCNYFLVIFPNKHVFLKINNFEGVYVYDFTVTNFDVADDLYTKYKEFGDTKFLSSTTVWLNIANDEKLDYFSVLNKGNHGFGGSNKMIEKIRKDGSRYYIINYAEYSDTKNYSGQFDTEIVEYIMENGKLVEELEQYKVYYFE